MNTQTTPVNNNAINPNNEVSVTGVISSYLTFSHKLLEKYFFSFYVDSVRLSDTIDSIPVIIPEELSAEFLSFGNIVKVKGQYRSYNKQDSSGNSHLLLYILASEIELVKDYNGIDNNSINLMGYIVKTPTYRETPLDRKISDVLLAVHRPDGKSDYIPCIFWGNNAIEVSNFDVGTKLLLVGRIQNRNYTKKLSDGSVEIRTAYEVSVRNFEKVE